MDTGNPGGKLSQQDTVTQSKRRQMHTTGQQGTYGLSTPSGRTRPRVTAGGKQDENERGCTTHLFTPTAPLATFNLAHVTRTTQSQHVTGDESFQLELEEYTGDNTTEKGRLATKHQSTIEAISWTHNVHQRCSAGTATRTVPTETARNG
jgi:hypothetical protein